VYCPYNSGKGSSGGEPSALPLLLCRGVGYGERKKEIGNQTMLHVLVIIEYKRCGAKWPQPNGWYARHNFF